MSTFAPDAEQDFALFKQETMTAKKRERLQFTDWLADHLASGGEVLEHYQPHNAVRWTLEGTCRLIHGKPLGNGSRQHSEMSDDRDPAKLAEKLLRRSLRFCVVLTYWRR